MRCRPITSLSIAPPDSPLFGRSFTPVVGQAHEVEDGIEAVRLDDVTEVHLLRIEALCRGVSRLEIVVDTLGGERLELGPVGVRAVRGRNSVELRPLDGSLFAVASRSEA